MSDLETLRDHARADWRAGEPVAPYCRENPWRVVAGESHPEPRHDVCHNGGCGCECHMPTDRERAMWRAIAEDIDRFLGCEDDDGEGMF